ncbi:type II toxin-antitoxin system VapC family toxin [Aureimonas leprariae]|uniref:Ribonuclease VapC n=1 Tax=Plantimonas leprariae TaxID=2615207 RepID=A0A7V7PNE2_9HYPH|nr:type II toxin-antitoxin system VapC family toxin [Aureimonas leprariae]KAB0679252.1 type II toxin-antitoxin system VapC family toxin [Aureimonas leprariae]
MIRAVLDASALLALMLDEKGAERVAAYGDHVAMASLNVGEVAAIYARRGVDDARIAARLKTLPFDVVPLDRDLAIEAGLLGSRTRRFGLSLGDRVCLCLARRLGVVAVTADRVWAKAAAELDVAVELIR